MKVALLSDIHANFAALRSVLDHVDRQAVDGVWVLGDIIGRGCDPSAVAAEMKWLYDQQTESHQACWLSGNHERFVLSQRDEFDIKRMGFAGANGELTLSGDNNFAIAVAMEHSKLMKYDDDLLDWLYSLPTYHEAIPERGVYLVHAALRFNGDTGEMILPETYGTYLLNTTAIASQFTEVVAHAPHAPHLILGGHTHISGVWQWVDDAVIACDVTAPHVVDLTRDVVYANPGSVGFPRGDDTCPTYMTLDFDDDFQHVEMTRHVVPYTPNLDRCWRTYPVRYKREMQRCTSS